MPGKSLSSHVGNWATLLAALVIAGAGGRSAWRAFALAAGASDAHEAKLEIRRVPRREQPLNINPRGAYRDFLTDQELAPIVASIEPCWPGPSIGHMLHSLRLWGP